MLIRPVPGTTAFAEHGRFATADRSLYRPGEAGSRPQQKANPEAAVATGRIGYGPNAGRLLVRTGRILNQLG